MSGGAAIVIIGFVLVLFALYRIGDTLWRIETMLSRRLEPDDDDDDLSDQ